MATLPNVFTDNYIQKKADERQSIAPKPLTSLPLASLPKITTKTSTPSTINSKASFVDKVASSEQLTPLANLKKMTAVKTPVQPINAISPVIKTTPYKPLSVKEESLSLPKDLRNTTLPIASKEVEISPVENFKKIAKSLIEPYTNPSESVKSLERQYGFIPNKPENTLDRVADVVSAPLRTIGKAVTRTIGGATEGYKNDLVEAIASYELTKKIKSGEVPLNVLDELEVLKKTYPQIAGDAALAVMSVYTPALLSKTAVNVAGKPILSAMLEGGIQSIPAGAGFGVAQAAASGSKDPKEIASIIGQSIAINGILGSIISGVIPAGAELSNRAQKIHNEIKLDAMSKGWSEAEAIKIANTGGYKGGVPKKGEGQLDLFESKSKELPKITSKETDTPSQSINLPKILRGTKGLTADDIIKKYPDIQLKKDVSATDVYGNKVTIPDGEALTPYELKGNKVLLQDGETYVVSKNQYQNIKGQSKTSEAKEFAPELKGTEETVLGVDWTDKEILQKGLPSYAEVAETPKGWVIKSGSMGEVSDYFPSREQAILSYNKGTLSPKAKPKYSQYQLPDGKNYKEVLIKAPKNPLPKALTREEYFKPGNIVKGYGGYDKVIAYHPENSKNGWSVDVIGVNPDGSPKAGEVMRSHFTEPDLSVKDTVNFKSSHWDEPNVISHLRLNERTYKGKKVTFMEELQSDWAREARSGKTKATDPRLKNWTEMSVKRALKEAVDNGSDYFAWINGEQTSARYSLATHLDNASWRPSSNDIKAVRLVTKNEKSALVIDVDRNGKIVDTRGFAREDWKDKKLDEVIGKGLADKIMEKETGTLSGEGLKFGGEWANNLYDKQVKNIVEDLTGSKVEVLDMGLPIKEEKGFIGFDKNGQAIDLTEAGLKIGDTVREKGVGKDMIITDVLGNGKFKAVKKEIIEDSQSWQGRAIPDLVNENKETFDISVKKTNQQGIKITPEIRAFVEGGGQKLKSPSGKTFSDEPVLPKIITNNISKEKIELPKISSVNKEEINYPNTNPESGVTVRGYIKKNREAVLSTIEISKSKQKNRLGTKYVKDFESWAKSNGAKLVNIDAYKGSVGFWEKQGYKLEKDFPVIGGHLQAYKQGTKLLVENSLPIELPKIITNNSDKYKGVYEKIVEELDAQHPLRKAQDAIYSKDRAKKIAAGSNIAKSVGGQEGFYAEKGALKGASEKIKSEGLSGKLSQEEIDAIFNDIRNYDWGNKRFQGTNAQEGFDRLLNGELIRDSEKKQLVKVIPRELIDVMDEVNKSLSDVDKAVIKVKRAMKDPDTLVNNLKEDIASYNERKIKLGKVKEITPDQEVTIKEKIKEINSIEDPKQKVQKFKELEDYMNSFVPSNISDIFINTWKAGLLTGIKTSGLNIMSNISHGTTEILKDLPASIVDIALTGSKKAYNTIPFLPDIKVPGRTTSFTLKGVTSGIAEGFKKGMEFMKSGVDERNTLDNIGMKKINMGSGVVNKGMQAYVNFVFKLMGAEDQPFYYGAYSHSLYKQAIAKAKNEGYSMLKSPKARNEFVKNIVENPTKEIAEAAHQDALTAVFQNDNKLVEFVKSAQRLGKDQKVPIGEIAIPFGKTPANVGLQIIKYTPVGTMATLANQVRKGTYDQRIIADAIGRGAVGSGILWLGYMMSQQNLISTDRPNGEREQKQWELEGKTPNSWYDPVTKKWRSIGVLGPAGSIMILGAQFQENYRESGSISKASLAAGLGGIKSFGEQPFVKGVNQIAEGFSNPERYASQLASGYVSSLVPTIVSDIARSTDTKDGSVTERRTEGIKDSIMARLPVIRTKLEPRIDVLGKEVQNASPLEVLIDPTRPSELGSSPTVDELKRLFRAGHPATPTLLSDKKSGFDSLTPKNNTDLWKYTGETIDFALGKLINSNNISEDFELDEKQYGNNTPYKNLPDELKAKAINNVVNKLKDYTRARFVMEITKDLSGSELLNRLAEYRDSGLFTRDVANIYERLTRPQE